MGRSLPRVGVVVVHWGDAALTAACLRRLGRIAYDDWTLVAVDNGTGALGAADLARQPASSTLLRSATNLGFAGGSNLGMREALRRGADYVWFLNNDAEPEPEALRELVAAAAHAPGYDIVGAKILQAHDPSRLDSIALQLDLRWGRIRLLGHGEADRGQYDGLSATDAVTGCAMLVSRRACERLGGFDEAFFAYLEDADLCLRARAAGMGVAAAPRARVHHRRPPAARGRQSVESLYYTTRNHLLLLDRHGGGTAARRALGRAAAIALSSAFALRSGPAARQRLAAVCRGVRDHRRGRLGRSAES